MVKDVVVVSSYNTLEEITNLLQTHDFKTFPLVDSDGELTVKHPVQWVIQIRGLLKMDGITLCLFC